jgi:CubicO group peptidase (beta-lactamase class C family)
MSESASKNKAGTADHWLPIANREDLLTFMQDAGDWAIAKPGERWFYLNEGYVLLGHIIEICSGQPYSDYIRQHILAPLDMQRTIFFPDEIEDDPDAAVPYLIANDKRQIAASYPFSPNLAKGGIISDLHDMAKYVSMFLNKGEYQGNPLISSDSMREMLTPRIPTASNDTSFGTPLYAYGIGIFPEFLGRKLYGHGGSVRVATSYMGFLPEDDLGVIVLANGGGYSPTLLGAYALASALDADPEELPFVRREQLLEDLSGSYQTYKGTMQAKVRKAGDMLTLTIEDRLSPATFPLSPHDLSGNPVVFRLLARDAKFDIEFHRKDGQTTLIYERYAFRRKGSL